MNSYLTTDELLKKVGNAIKTLRLNKNLPRDLLVEDAGVSINALRHLEDGEGATLRTLVQIVQALKKDEWLLSLAPEISINPLHLGKKRARRKVNKVTREERSDLKHKADNLKRKYGMTVTDFINMYNTQEGKCGNKECTTTLMITASTTHVDHCHTTGKVRSLLCNYCNSALGMIKENVNTAKGLIDYIKKHN